MFLLECKLGLARVTIADICWSPLELSHLARVYRPFEVVIPGTTDAADEMVRHIRHRQPLGNPSASGSIWRCRDGLGIVCLARQKWYWNLGIGVSIRQSPPGGRPGPVKRGEVL
jgi:hypothetical protein